MSITESYFPPHLTKRELSGNFLAVRQSGALVNSAQSTNYTLRFHIATVEGQRGKEGSSTISHNFSNEQARLVFYSAAVWEQFKVNK